MMDLESLTEKPVFFAFREPAQIDPAVAQSTLSDTQIMDSSALNARKDNTREDNTNDSTKLRPSAQSTSSPADYTPPVSSLEDNIAFISFSGRVIPPRIQTNINGCIAQFHQLKTCKENIAQDKLSMGEVDAIMAYAHRQLEEKAARIATSLKSFEEEIKDGMEAKHAINKAEENTERNDKDPANTIESVHRKNTLLRELNMNALSIGHVVARADSIPDMDEEQKTLVVRQMALASLEDAGAEEEQKLTSRNQSLNNQYQALCKQQYSLHMQQQSLDKQQQSLDEQHQSLEEAKQSLDEQLRSFSEQKQSLEEEDGQLVNKECDINVPQALLADKLPALHTKENR